MDGAIRIGHLAARTGASARALRYYEEQGLLRSERTSGGQRVYEADAVERVRLLRRLYDAGLSSATIAALLPCVDAPSDDVTAESIEVLRREHDRLSSQILELTTTREHLAALIGTVVRYQQAGTADVEDAAMVAAG